MATNDFILSKEELQKYFEYRDAKLYWKVKGSGILKDECGWLDKLGYRSIGFKRKTYKAHRLVFLLHHGYLPKCIDHIDGNPLNNAIENLREAKLIENSWNQKKRITNTTGVKGVSFAKKSKKYTARCMLDGVSYFLGEFVEINKAKNVLIEFRNKTQGNFARHY